MSYVTLSMQGELHQLSKVKPIQAWTAP